MPQVIEVGSVESTCPLWSVCIVQAPVIVVLVAVTTHGYSEINFIVCVLLNGIPSDDHVHC